ncbi:MAG: hypothetical protein ACRDD9_20475 [Shewanella sp.]
MKSLVEKQALSLTAVGRLKLHGCEVISINTQHLTPVIVVDKPPLKLRSKAVCITEVLHGVVSKICVASFNGCLVRWPDDGIELPVQICQTLNPYSPELISVWPRNF